MRRIHRSLLACLPVAIAAAAFSAARLPPEARLLRVCADPNNLPFSNARGEGFENRIAELIARDLGATVSYTWWAQRRGFFRNTLNAGACDVVLGVPSTLDLLATSRPYYRSSYAFVTRPGDGPPVRSFDDPRLKRRRVGIHIAGDDGSNLPPAHALAARGIIHNVHGYTLYGDYSQPDPPARLIEAVSRGDVDIAIAWGPLAGYFAARQKPPLIVNPVERLDDRGLPFAFDISLGVRRADRRALARLEAILDRRRAEIEAILATYRVPRVEPSSGTAGNAPRSAESPKR